MHTMQRSVFVKSSSLQHLDTCNVTSAGSIMFHILLTCQDGWLVRYYLSFGDWRKSLHYTSYAIDHSGVCQDTHTHHQNKVSRAKHPSSFQSIKPFQSGLNFRTIRNIFNGIYPQDLAPKSTRLVHERRVFR